MVSPVEREKNHEDKVANGDLAPIELFFIGGSESTGDRFYSSRTLIEELRVGPMSESYLRPLSLTKGEKNVGRVIGDREGRFMVGTLGFLGIMGARLYDEGLVPRVTVAELDAETGLIIPKWQLELVENGRLYVGIALDSVKPVGIIGSLLNAERTDGSVELTLKGYEF